MKAFALIDTKKGYRLTLVAIVRTNFGGIRKYSIPNDLYYKKKEFAYSKALDFYTSLYGGVKFFGIIEDNEFTGEPASEADYNLFSKWLSGEDKREFGQYKTEREEL